MMQLSCTASRLLPLATGPFESSRVPADRSMRKRGRRLIANLSLAGGVQQCLFF